MRNFLPWVAVLSLLISNMFYGMHERLERDRALYWKSEYYRLWNFCKMVEIPVRNLTDIMPKGGWANQGEK